MSVDNRALGLQVILCLVLIFFSDGFIKGYQLSKVKVQSTDNQPSSVIRRNILHSEAISNRPSSSLLAKQPAEPAFQEQQNNIDAAAQKNRDRNQNINRPVAPKKLGSRSEKSNFVVNGDETKVRRDLEILQLRDQVERDATGNTVLRWGDSDQGSFISKLNHMLSENKLRNFVASLKSLAMGEGGLNFNLVELIKVLNKVVISDLDSSMTSDMVWSLGKLNFVVQNYDHKSVLVALMDRFCEHEEMTPREVTTSLVSTVTKEVTSFCSL